jgi:DNA polymerase (family 10)
MSNEELADVLTRIADLLEIKGEILYKFLAYRKAADSLRNLAENADTLYRQGRLTEIPGVGKAISEKIGELLDTGKLEFLQRLESEVPPSLVDLLEVPDVGPKKAALFWKQAGITTLAELESAARAGSLRQLPGLGERSEARILAGIEALARRGKRLLLGTARPLAQRWIERLRGLPGVAQVEAAGSLRRWRATIGDLDAACSDPAPLMQAFTSDPEVVRVLGQGENKSSIELGSGTHIQLWAQPPERFGTLWQFVSGSKDHNVRLRELAQRRGFSLSERCLQEPEGKELLFAREEDVYAALGLAWIPPELREDRGEIQAALSNSLPRLVQSGDLTADLHMHTVWSDGSAGILDMARAAQSRGLQVIAITDHSGGLGVAGGLNVERLRQQCLAIEAAQTELGDSIRLLHGTEVDIRSDGTLDYPDEVLAELDIVVASLHASLRQPREAITARLLNAIRNPHVDVIGHPSGRLLNHRESADLDWEAILPAARQHGLALEINANPSRLDLDEVYAHRAIEMGIPLTISTDAHSLSELALAIYGVSVARRAWASPQHILSTWQPAAILEWLKRKKT